MFCRNVAVSDKFYTLLTQSGGRGAKSTALNPLQWVIGILVGVLPTLVLAKAPEWMLISDCCVVGCLLLLFGVAYFILLVKNVDALRSEHYTLSKMAMERGLVGDSDSGFVKPVGLRKELTEDAPGVVREAKDI